MAIQETSKVVESAARRVAGNLENAGETGNGHSRRGSKRLAKALGWFSVGLGAAELIAPGSVSKLIGGRKNNKLVRSMGARQLGTGVAILTLPFTMPFLWARVGGDAVDLTLLGRALKSSATSKGRMIAATAAVAGVTALDAVCTRRLMRRNNA